MGSKKVIIVAVICGVAAVLLTNLYINQLKDSVKTMELIKVVVAKTDIEEKTELKAEMVELKEVPKQYSHAKAITKVEDVVGGVLTTKTLKGEPILVDKVAKKGETQEGLAYIVPKGLRAITIGVNEVTGVADLVKPGDKVDLIGLMEVEKTNSDGSQGTEPMAKLTLQNLEVLAIGKSLTEVVDKSKKEGEQAQSSKTVTLAVKPNDGEKITLLTEKGIIRLMLRSPVETEATSPQPYTPASFKQN